MDCSGGHVFFPVHKTGFCLSQSRGCLDGGELRFGFFSPFFVHQIWIALLDSFVFVQAEFLAFDTGTFWDTILLCFLEIFFRR
jgi:hypothetical protein